jgi:hypothetical protein
MSAGDAEVVDGDFVIRTLVVDGDGSSLTLDDGARVRLGEDTQLMIAQPPGTHPAASALMPDVTCSERR